MKIPAKAAPQRGPLNYKASSRHSELAKDAIENAFFVDTVAHLKEGGDTIRKRMKAPIDMEALKLSLLKRGRVVELKDGAAPLAIRRIENLQALPPTVALGNLGTDQAEQVVQVMANKSLAKIEKTFDSASRAGRLTPDQHELEAKYLFVLESLSKPGFSFVKKAAEQDVFVRDVQRTANEIGLQLVLLPDTLNPVAILPSLSLPKEQLAARRQLRPASKRMAFLDE